MPDKTVTPNDILVFCKSGKMYDIYFVLRKQNKL